VLRRHEVVGNAHVVHNALIEEFEQPGLGRVRQPRPAALFSATPAGIAAPAHRLGEDTVATIAALGYSECDIRKLKADGTAVAYTGNSDGDAQT
jgi:crotonobetainyl-CoA:carnitine CoA-transferase CaiB-like acyl-CoA transferase